MRVFLLMCVAVCLATSAAVAAPTTLRVSPWRGGGDFTTLTAARDALRKLKQQGRLREGAVVLVEPGRYDFTKPLVLGPEDSGTANAPIVWRGMGPTKPVLRAAKTLTGFKPYRGKILQCDLKANGLAGKSFNQLFFRGKRQILARYPNFDPNDVHGGKWAHVAAVEGQDNYREFYYGEDETHNWAHPQDGSVPNFAGRDWSFRINAIAKHVPAERKIVLKGRTWCPLAIGDRYFVQGLFEELDAPGEWYRDPRTDILYFWPPDTIRPGDVAAPVADNVIKLDGAAYVTVQGFEITGSLGTGVQVTNSKHCLVAGNTIHNVGGWGVSISGGEYCGAQGNDVSWCGEGGIAIRAGDRKTLAPGNCFADNNYVHHCANLWLTYRQGIRVSGVGNRASHNLVHDMPHAGMNVGGNDNVIEYNRVHHVNLQSADTGGIYFCSRDWTQRGNVIRYNIFHHCGGFGKANSWRPLAGGKVKFSYPHFTWGIYLDDPTTGTHVYGNIIYNAPVCALHNHGGRDNVWENNILVNCTAFRAGQLSPTWREWPSIFKKLRANRYPGSPYLAKYPEIAGIQDTNPQEMSGIKFRRNIVYCTIEGTRWLRKHFGKSWGGQLVYSLRMRPYDFERNEWDYNCIYMEPGLEPRVDLTLTPKPGKKLSWDQWRALGADSHSVLADPLFVDAKNHDYRLRPDSPALKLGFKPIPIDKIGPYEDNRRASWPIVEAPGAAALGEFTTERYYEPPQFKRLPAREVAVRGGLPNFFAKAKAGKPLKVAYFGGGIHPPSGWRKPVMDWLRKRCGKIEVIEAGITDATRGCAFSVYRFRREVLDKKPDLVLVDFAASDRDASPVAIIKTIEGITRQARRADPTLDLLFLYAFREGYEKSYDEGLYPPAVSAYERVARHYGAPSISMGYRVAKLVREGKLLVKKPRGANAATKPAATVDGRRPTPHGNKIYAEAIIAGLEQLAAIAKPARHTLPKPLDPGNYERARQVRITPAMLAGDWKRLAPNNVDGRDFSQHFDEVWFTNTPGAKLSFKFKGTHASIFALIGPDTGQVRVTLDGKSFGVRRQVDKWCYYQRLSALTIAGGLEDKVHTATLELIPDVPDRSQPIAEAKRLDRYDPNAFEGVALRFGSIRLIGELVGGR